MWHRWVIDRMRQSIQMPRERGRLFLSVVYKEGTAFLSCTKAVTTYSAVVCSACWLRAGYCSRTSRFVCLLLTPALLFLRVLRSRRPSVDATSRRRTRRATSWCS